MASARVFMGNPNDLMRALEREADNSRRHFVDRHEEILINSTQKVDLVVKDLLEEELLSEGQHGDISRIRSSQDKMRRLYQYVYLWDSEDKDSFFQILKKHNATLIAKMKRVEGRSEDEDEDEGEDEGAASSRSFLRRRSQPRLSPSHEDGMDCDVCGKIDDPADIPIMPIIIGNTYRLEMKRAGRFCCSETRIKFQVSGPVTVEYEVESWYKYRRDPQPLGPLFSIQAPVEPGLVTAVYLPHYLCLKAPCSVELSGDKSWIKCAHFKDGNLIVESPSQILPYHVVLDNPTFSSLGVFCWNLLPKAVTQFFPIHGKVLLYFKTAGRQCLEYKIHLYLMPAFAPVDKDFLQEKTSNGFKKVDKPPRTKTLYTKKKYVVKGPDKAYVQPVELDVECASPLESFTDITIDSAEEIIDLCLTRKVGKGKVWACRVSRGEVEELKSQVPTQVNPRVISPQDWEAKSQFVDRFQESLIRSVSLVDPVLDSLVTQKLLTNEEYDIIRSKTTSQGQMRELYRVTREWGDTKGKIYDALQKYNAPIIQKLSQA